MKTTIIIHEDIIEVLKEGYNIIEKTIYTPETIKQAQELLTTIKEEM